MLLSGLSQKKKDKVDARLKTGWRYQLVGKQLVGLLNGEVGLTVKNGRVELL